MASKRITVALRLDPALRDRLDAAAEERDLGRNALAARLLERGLDQLAPIVLRADVSGLEAGG